MKVIQTGATGYVGEGMLLELLKVELLSAKNFAPHTSKT